MALTTYTLSFEGAMTDRGFWLYVWRVSALDNRELLYVGMTGGHIIAKRSVALRTHGATPGPEITW